MSEVRLIDEAALINEAETGGWDVDIKELKMILKYVPEISAVPVVRCGKCLHYCEPVVSRDTGLCSRLDRLVETDDYCSYGGRR
jgi:hypothetical protein